MGTYEPHFLFLIGNLNSFDLLNTCGCTSFLQEQNFVNVMPEEICHRSKTSEKKATLGNTQSERKMGETRLIPSSRGSIFGIRQRSKHQLWWKSINLLSYSVSQNQTWDGG